MAFTALTTAEVDAKSPIDDLLMGKIKDNFDDLNTRVSVAGAAPFPLEVQGKLSFLSTNFRSIAMGIVNKEFTPTICRFMLKKSGTSGSLAFDIRKHTQPKTPITEIAHQYTAATSSIAQQGSALNTQSIARATTQISTQTITHAKAAKNIQSIILLGTVEINGVYYTNLVQYNLDATIDSDTVIGDSFVAASATSAGNNGTFVILEKNRGGGNNVVIRNAAGVAQTGAVGTIQEKIMSYNFTNPVSTLFTAGYSHSFASHTSSLNSGTLLVYAINQSGNNIWVKNAAGVTQGSAAGTVDCNFWIFALSSAASTTDYVVGEKAKTASHTSGGNNAGALTIIAVNSSGNNLVLYNTAGVAQGGVAGTINTNRWKYNLPSDPTSDVNVGDTMYMSGHTNVLNDGTFTIKDKSSSTVVVYNESGVAQASTPGNVYTTKKLVKFSSDQSAVYSTSSFIEMIGCVSSLYNFVETRAPFQVLQVNRGGGANYNVVIDQPTGPAQASPCGFVQTEMKSIFSVAPSLAASVTGLEPNHNIAGTSSDLSATVIPAQTPLMLYITSYQAGDPQDLTIFIQ